MKSRDEFSDRVLCFQTELQFMATWNTSYIFFQLNFPFVFYFFSTYLPVSVLYQKVLLNSFHKIPEALVKDFPFAVRLAGYQGCPQLTEVLW